MTSSVKADMIRSFRDVEGYCQESYPCEHGQFEVVLKDGRTVLSYIRSVDVFSILDGWKKSGGSPDERLYEHFFEYRNVEPCGTGWELCPAEEILTKLFKSTPTVKSSPSSSDPQMDWINGIASSAISLMWEVSEDQSIGKNLSAMCTSKAFKENPRDAVVNWLLNGCKESVVGGHSEYFAFPYLMICIPNFEEVFTVEYLESFGERYFAQSSTKDQSLEILRKQLRSSSSVAHLKRAVAFFSHAKNPAEDSIQRFIYAGEVQSNMEHIWKVFRHAEQLRFDECESLGGPE